MKSIVPLLPLVAIMVAFLYFGQRRQKRAMQATIDLHDSLRIGDRIHTSAGLEATITGIGDDTIELEIAPGVITTWMKMAVRDKIEPDTDEEADAEDEDFSNGADATGAA